MGEGVECGFGNPVNNFRDAKKNPLLNVPKDDYNHLHFSSSRVSNLQKK